jgi:hypothetical protein
VIEAHDPGCHQFVPIELTLHDGSAPPEPYYLLIIGLRFPAMIFEDPADQQWQTHVRTDRPGGEPFVLVGWHDTRWALSRPARAGRHLFSSDIASFGGLYMSDPLAEALADIAPVSKSAHGPGIRWLQFRPAPETDAPWVAEEQIRPWVDWAEQNPERAAEIRRGWKRGRRD